MCLARFFLLFVLYIRNDRYKNALLMAFHKADKQKVKVQRLCPNMKHLFPRMDGTQSLRFELASGSRVAG